MAMQDNAKTPRPAITKRQREVVALIAAGYSNDEVGRALCITTRTARAHADALRERLHVTRRRYIPAAYRAATGEDPLLVALEQRTPSAD
jgi:DNA-binding CsgD family transcriptional regulator